MVSAVTMSLLQIFDIRKFMFLLNAYTHQDTMLNQRAIAGIALTCYYYEKRILQYPEAVSRINELNENSEFIKNLHHIQIQLLQSSRETRKIDKKMREEIIPEMMKIPNLIWKDWMKMPKIIIRNGKNGLTVQALPINCAN